MVFIRETNDYILLKRIRIIMLFILSIMRLTALVVISYFVTCNSSSINCNPTEILNEFVDGVNSYNAKKIVSLTNINCDNVRNSEYITDTSESLTKNIENCNLKKIYTSGSHLVLQTSDYIIYNTTFDITNKSGEKSKETVPIMFVKDNDGKWYIDYSSVLSAINI